MTDDESYADPAPRRGGRLPGRPNYQNNILISIVERLLPNGNEGWRLVALAYQQESGEEILRSEDDLKKNWFRKLCNSMKKPTGRMGADAKDRINRCIQIERKILDKTSSGVLGASSEEDVAPSSSSSSADEEAKEESEDEDEVVPGTEVQPQDFASFSQPPALPPLEFPNEQDTHPEEPSETNLVNGDSANAVPDSQGDGYDGGVAFVTRAAERSSITSSTVARAGGRTPPPIAATKKPRKSDKTIKTKNSTNRERGSVTKSIERIASSIVDGRGEDLQTFMMMRKMDWEEAEERRRQEREEARREREEARREREEMEDRRDRRMERQMNQQNQMMQMMMMMMMGGGSKTRDAVANNKESEEE